MNFKIIFVTLVSIMNCSYTSEDTALISNEQPIQSRCLPSCCYNQELTRTCCPLSSCVVKTYGAIGENSIQGCCDSSIPAEEERAACTSTMCCVTGGVPICIAFSTLAAPFDCLYCTFYGTPSSCYKHCKKAQEFGDDAELVSIDPEDQNRCCWDRTNRRVDCSDICKIGLISWFTKMCTGKDLEQ